MRIRLQLAQDFTAEVFKVFKEQPGTLISDAIRIAADHPAPSFYCTYNTLNKLFYLYQSKSL